VNNLNKIVDLIIKELFNTQDINSSKQSLIKKLLHSGIDPEEIDRAFSYIETKIRENDNTGKKRVRKLRVLTSLEKCKLSPEAQKSLYLYYYNDYISWMELEEIIIDLSKIDRVINEKELDLLIEKNLFAKKNKSIMVCGLEIN